MAPSSVIDPIPVAVLGASGFTGGELLRLLSGHPNFDVAYAGGRSSTGRRLSEVHPHLTSLPIAGRSIRDIDPAAVAAEVRLAFCALPRGVSAEVAPALLDAGVEAVVDLGGDFRLEAEHYPTWYGFDHPAPALLDEAAYGLPELFEKQVSDARLVANPGCFPTPAVLGLAPLVGAGLVADGPIRVDGKTGISGAGREAGETASMAASEESIRPYRLPGHQHTPEIERGIELATGSRPPVVFAPHLVPSVRGVLTTCFAPLAEGATTEDLTEALDAAYRGRPFVGVLDPGGMVDTKHLRASNRAELQAVADPRTGTAVVIGAIDNLGKGAAGQAIQNANLLLGLAEDAGLPTAGVWP